DLGFQVQGGVVTLQGSVPSPEVQQQIASTVGQVPGVTQVVDQLAVGAQTGATTTVFNPETDRLLQLRLRQTVLPQIQVNGEPQLSFDVNNGVVTINGNVSNTQQRDVVENLVR